MIEKRGNDGETQNDLGRGSKEKKRRRGEGEEKRAWNLEVERKEESFKQLLKVFFFFSSASCAFSIFGLRFLHRARLSFESNFSALSTLQRPRRTTARLRTGTPATRRHSRGPLGASSGNRYELERVEWEGRSLGMSAFFFDV